MLVPAPTPGGSVAALAVADMARGAGADSTAALESAERGGAGRVAGPWGSRRGCDSKAGDGRALAAAASSSNADLGPTQPASGRGGAFTANRHCQVGSGRKVVIARVNCNNVLGDEALYTCSGTEALTAGPGGYGVGAGLRGRARPDDIAQTSFHCINTGVSPYDDWGPSVRPLILDNPPAWQPLLHGVPICFNSIWRSRVWRWGRKQQNKCGAGGGFAKGCMPRCCH